MLECRQSMLFMKVVVGLSIAHYLCWTKKNEHGSAVGLLMKALERT